jgi:heat shock protein HtpX
MANGLKTTLLLGLMTGLFIAIGGLLGGRSGMVMAFVLALIMNFVSFWFSDKIVLKMYGAQPIGEADAPMVYRIVRNLATKAGIPMPKLYLIPAPTPNAFATGRSPRHAAVAGAISMLANMAQWSMFFGGGRDEEGRGANPIAMIATIIFAPLAAMLIQMAVSRSREFQADASGARLTRRPLGLASALGKLHQANQIVPMNANPATSHLFIVNPLSGRSLANLFATHPPIEERIARLRAM